jgi:hypothetical protein
MHLKKAVALAVATVLVVALGALAQEPRDPKMTPGSELKAGTVTRLDSDARMISVKTASKEGVPGADAKELTLYWDQATKVEGTLREGELIHFRAAEKDGKTVATFIRVGKVDRPKPQSE